jgi:osmotically-inducible protein OsmY
MTDTSKMDSSELDSKVAERLAALPDVDASAVEAHTEGTTVVLEGAVDTIMSARKVVFAAETVDGVHDVENHLTLTGRPDAQTH